MKYFFLILFIFLVGLANYFGIKALNNLSEDYKNRKHYIIYRRGVFVKKEFFNDVGWKYQRWEFLTAILALPVFLIAVWFFMHS